MRDIEKRFLLFLLGCMPARLSLVFVAFISSSRVLRLMAVPAAFVAAGMFVIFAGGFRKTGAETMGAPIWWDLLRPVHACLYALFSYSAWNGQRERAWRVLLADAVLALGSFATYHIAAS